MKRRLQKAGIILSILLVILAAGYFAGTWYLKQKNEGTKQTTAQADGLSLIHISEPTRPY